MLKSHAFPDKERPSTSVTSQPGTDEARDVVGHADVGQLQGLYYGNVLPNHDYSSFPSDEDELEFVISTGDLCRAKLVHPDLRGWWRHYLITRGPSGMLATPYLATIPRLRAGRSFGELHTAPLAYSGESLMVINMSYHPRDFDQSCSFPLVSNRIRLYKIDEDGVETEETHNLGAGSTTIITPAEDDLSVVYRAEFDDPAVDQEEGSGAIFAFQAETDVNPDIPLRAG